MTFQSTAIYPNRVEDKEKLEKELGLSEEGNPETEFYDGNDLLFKGYDRIVYGDHGPYIEFSFQHIKCKLFSKFGNSVSYRNLPDENYKYYYFWLLPKSKPHIKVYLQIKTVHNLPNAPRRADGKKSNYNRTEGYADYKRGLFYVDPYSLKTI